MRKFLTFLTLLTLSIGVGWAETVSDVLDVSFTGVTGSSYTDWSGKTGNSGAVYAGQSANGSNSIQIRSKNSNSGIITTGSAGKVKSLTFTFTTVGNGVTVYGKNSAYSSPSDLYSSSDRGTSLGDVTANGTLTVSGDYEYIGIRSKNGAVYISSLSIVWETGGSTPSGPTAPTATVGFSPAAGEVESGTTVTLTLSGTADGFVYTTDSSAPSATNGTKVTSGTATVTVSAATTIKAAAYNNDGSTYAFGTETSATYTIATPVVYDGSATFNATVDVGTSPLVKNPVTFACSNGVLNNSSEYRLYSGSTTTFSVPTGYKIVKIEFTGNSSSNSVSNLSVATGSTGTYTTSNNFGTWIGEAESVSFKANAQARASLINVYYTAPASTGPEYYLVGEFSTWTQNANYKFFENNGTFTLDNVSLPANAQFKIIKVDNGITWYGGTGDVVYNIHHTHHTNLPMNGSQNYNIQSAGVTSFSFTVNDNTPSNLNVNREAKLYIKGDFNSWAEELMTATSNGWTTTQTIAANNEFGFVDEFGQFRGKEWTILSEHMNGYEIPMETNGNYKMGIAGSYTLNVNSGLTTLVVNDQSQSSGDEFELVTDASTLNEGDLVVVMSAGTGSGYAISNAEKANNRSAAGPLTITASKVTPDSDTQIFELEGDATGWYFKNIDGFYDGQYLYTNNNSKARLLSKATKDNYCKTTISIGGSDNAVITFQGITAYNVMRYNANNGSPLFACYTSGQGDVYIFRKAGSAPAPKAATPTFSPAGATYDAAQSVTISCETPGATIYYNYGNSTPAISSENQYDGPITVNSSCTITAIAVADGYRNSDPATVTYTINLPQVATPTFSPEAGTYNEAQSVTISCETTGATIYYTTDGSTPSTSSTEYTGAITVSETMTIKAIAVATGYGNSEVATAAYTIDTTIPTTGDYAKVTSTDDLEDGDYLIVYEGNLVAFNGSLETLDAVENTVDIVIATDGKIVSNPTVDAAVFTWDSAAGTLKSASGYYIGKTTTGNGLETSTTEAYTNAISFEDGNVLITASGGSVLKFNSASNQLRFRYYGSGQQNIQLYKVSSSSVAKPVITPGSQVMTAAIDATITCATPGATIYYTLDGSTPTTSSEVYSGPIHIAEPTVTLNAIAVLDEAQSQMATAVYSGVWVNNIAEYNALEKGTTDIVFKNPVIVQYHYISSSKNYIYVKDDSGCAYFNQPGVSGENAISQLENGDIIGAGFSGNKVSDEMVSDEESHFFMLTNLANFAANGDKGLADPEHETVARIADATTGVALNNHYITIKKVKLSALYQPSDITYGGAKYFDIDNVAHIGYNKFNIDYSVVDDLDAYYDITGILTAYNNTMEFHPTEIVKWEETVVTLRQLCDEGVTTDGENEYTISNNLMCVYAKDNSIWVKDDTGQSIWMTEPGENEQNYEIEIADNTRPNQAYYDQSNWCEIVLTSGDASSFKDKIIKGGSIHGSFVDKTNPKMTGVTLTSDDVSSDGEYDPNYYVPANFFGTQSCAGPMNHGTFFFMNPKPQEYARIAVAVYDGTKMVLPKGTATDNQGNTIEVNGHDFQGSFSVDMSMNGSSVTLERGSYYTDFEAIIRLKSADSGNGAPMRKAAPTGYEYEVFPLSIVGGGVLTGVETIAVKDASREVVATEYYNVAGQRSDRPVEGINIVVTRYSDGSTSTAKVLK